MTSSTTKETATPARASVSTHEPQAPPPTTGSAFVRSLLENIECLAIAVVMALVLKYFLIEAYKIPTGSMQPTIMGDEKIQIFDRVLVNKLVYFFREPKRWEVIVFKMPLSQRQNYIKRLIGLPGEQMTIRNGDIFITPAGSSEERVARKPDSVWSSVRKRMLPVDLDDFNLARRFRSVQNAEVGRERIYLKPKGDEEAQIKLKRGVMDYYYDGYDPAWIPSRPKKMASNPVGDVEVVAEVTFSAASEVGFSIEEGSRTHQGRWHANGRVQLISSIAPSANDTQVVFDETREAPPLGKPISFSLRNVDDELVILIGGDEVCRYPYVTRGVDRRVETHLKIRAWGSAVELADVCLYRDIHYTPEGKMANGRSATFRISEGHFFALGDNTQNSHDCRQWEKASVRLLDGRVIEGNWFNSNPRDPHPDANPKYYGDEMVFTNIYGEDMTISRENVAGNFFHPETVPFPLIPREFLLGKALAVFWPLPPFSPSWRLKWVR